MKELTFITSNEHKFLFAKITLEKFGIGLKKITYDIEEIQSEDAEKIARDKAQKAYELHKKPLVVNDDSWSIWGLKGFPGPYMKSVNHWFEPNDFINLTKSLKDRRVSLLQISVYQDENGQKVFKKEIKGKLLKEADLLHKGVPIMKVVSLTADGKSLAEVRQKHAGQLSAEKENVWHRVGEWLNSPV